MSEASDPGREAILRALERNDVLYVVIGGAAAQTHGWPGPTYDIDVTPQRSRENLSRLAAAMGELDAAFRVDPDRYPDGFRPPGGFDWRTFRNQEWMTLSTPYGNVDVVLMPDGTNGYEDIVATATRQRVSGTQLVVPVASAEVILRSKESAGRQKDLEVLDQMRAIIDPWRSREGPEPPGR